MSEFLEQLVPLDLGGLTAFLSIIVIDIVMSGDNAIVIGMAVAGLPPHLRRKSIMIGVVAATILRICFALIVVELLEIKGILLAGGLLLLWVCWKMWRELRYLDAAHDKLKSAVPDQGAKTFRQAITVIIIADVSMSLDNILAVGGAAQGHHGLLVFGLILSIVLMAFAANFIAKILQNHRWIAYVGLAVIAYVSGDMIWRGTGEVLELLI